LHSSDLLSLNVEKHSDNQKSLTLASALFPNEEWILTEVNILVAKSRLVEEKKEPKKWTREMSQVRILTSKGNWSYEELRAIIGR